MSVELVTGLVLVVAMLASVLVKYLTTVRIVRVRERLASVESEVRTLRSRLKTVTNEKIIAQGKERNVTRQKDRLEKRIPKLDKELKDLEGG